MPVSTRPAPVRRLLLGAATTFVVLGVAACSGSASVSTTPTVARSALEKEVSTELAKQVGQTPDSVTCPGDLTGKQGTTERCSLTADGTTYGLTVTVTSVQGSDVRFGIKVDNQPES